MEAVTFRVNLLKVIGLMQTLDFLYETFGAGTREDHVSIISNPGVKIYLLQPGVLRVVHSPTHTH